VRTLDVMELKAQKDVCERAGRPDPLPHFNLTPPITEEPAAFRTHKSTDARFTGAASPAAAVALGVGDPMGDGYATAGELLRRLFGALLLQAYQPGICHYSSIP